MRRSARAALIFLVLGGYLHSQRAAAQDGFQVTLPAPTQQPADKQAAVSPEALKWQTQTREVLAIVGDDKMNSAKRTAAYETLMKLKPSAKDAEPLQLAFVLLAINQKKNNDALSMTEQILSEYDKSAPARAMRARLLLISSRMPQAIVELESLIETLKEKDLTASQAQLEHAARFLGLALGYFNGPGSQGIRPTALAELIAAAQQLPPDLLNAYESAKLAIEEEYRVLTEEGEEALKALREGLEKEAAAMRAQLEAERAKAANESDYARAELQTNFAQLNSQWQNAWNASQMLMQQGSDIRRRQAQLQISISALRPPRQDSEGNVDPFDQQRYLNELSFLQNGINNLDFQLQNVAGQYANVRSQGLLIERQMYGLQNRARQMGMELAMRNESFNRIDNAIRQKENAAAKAETKKKSKEQLRRERAFSTYDDFNIHKEKKLLLDAIAEKSPAPQPTQ